MVELSRVVWLWMLLMAIAGWSFSRYISRRQLPYLLVCIGIVLVWLRWSVVPIILAFHR